MSLCKHIYTYSHVSFNIRMSPFIFTFLFYTSLLNSRISFANTSIPTNALVFFNHKTKCTCPFYTSLLNSHVSLIRLFSNYVSLLRTHLYPRMFWSSSIWRTNSLKDFRDRSDWYVSLTFICLFHTSFYLMTLSICLFYTSLFKLMSL